MKTTLQIKIIYNELLIGRIVAFVPFLKRSVFYIHALHYNVYIHIQCTLIWLVLIIRRIYFSHILISLFVTFCTFRHMYIVSTFCVINWQIKLWLLRYGDKYAMMVLLMDYSSHHSAVRRYYRPH